MANEKEKNALFVLERIKNKAVRKRGNVTGKLERKISVLFFPYMLCVHKWSQFLIS